MKSILIPKSLSKGDKIAIISTARKIDKSKLEEAIILFQKWGLEAVLGANLYAEDNQFCGTDLERAADLQWALNDPEIKAIVCFRGGYGTVRIIGKVDFSLFTKNPKWICGYSDITALHNYIGTHCNAASMHSTMPINFQDNTIEALDTFRKALFGESFSILVKNHGLNREGVGEGLLVGGNLSMLYSLSGTKYDIETDGKILFLEDLDEYLYHIDRMMWNLKLSGKLKNLKGLVVGGMTSMHDNEVPFGKQAEEIIIEAVQEYDFPVCFNFPAGHIDDNRTLIFNRQYRLDVGNEVTLNQL